jgi:hypothetical protein
MYHREESASHDPNSLALNSCVAASSVFNDTPSFCAAMLTLSLSSINCENVNTAPHEPLTGFSVEFDSFLPPEYAGDTVVSTGHLRVVGHG